MSINKCTGFGLQEDGTIRLWAAVTSYDGTGSFTGVPGQGYWIKQADLTSITCKIFDRSSATPDTAIATPIVTISSTVVDTPDESGVLASDGSGNAVTVNFMFTLAGTNFPTGGHEYLVETYWTTTGGATWTLQWEDIASPVIGS